MKRFIHLSRSSPPTRTSRTFFHSSATACRPQNLVEKIVQQFTIDAGGREVRALDFVTIRPRHVMTHDNTAAVIKKFDSIAASLHSKSPSTSSSSPSSSSSLPIHNPRQPVFALDHNIQDKSEANLARYARIRAFAAERGGIDYYPPGRGIGHQVICEEGYAWPGTLVVASDSHANMYGGLGCLGTPVVRTDAAAIWATGATWWQVPPVARVELRGRLPQHATGKDVIITLCGLFNADQVLNHAVEFVGDGVPGLSVDQRLTIANMTTEWGALAGLFPIDPHTLEWLHQRSLRLNPSNGGTIHPRINSQTVEALERSMPSLVPDKGAHYARELVLDLSRVRPHVSGPNQVKAMHSVDEMARRRVKVDKAYIVSCTNSRVQDLAAAAGIVRGKRVAPGVELYIAAASSEVESDSVLRGDWQALVDAGAIPLPPGCGPCIGLGAGLLQAGEVGISATNRNFKGRMGSREADVYLASPHVVAASALAGIITGPDYDHNNDHQDLLPQQDNSFVDNDNNATTTTTTTATATTTILPGFVEKLEGELVFCDQDNINTDGIYPGKYTYDEDRTAQQQADVAMENYDPAFTRTARRGDLLVSGFNFGTGSSREQAATCLKHAGIPLVLAGSFSETYKRNAFNNGFLVIEVPQLINYLRQQQLQQQQQQQREPTRRTGVKAVVDFRKSELRLSVGDVGGEEEKRFGFAPVGAVAQEIVLVGGLEQWVEHKLLHPQP